MTIHIEELTFDCIIGLLDFERITPQKVILDIEIDYIYYDNLFINYADVISLVQNNMLTEQYELLETALNKLEELLLLNYSTIQTLKIKITKPNIITNAKVALSKKITKI